MKINWGVGIVIAFGAFIGFILFFIVKMTTDKKYEHELVTESYYKQELNFQSEINAEENRITDHKQVVVNITQEGLQLVFLNLDEKASIAGEVTLYRPSNQKLDFNMPLVLAGNTMNIPSEKILSGRWNLSVSWTENGRAYLFKKAIVF